MKITVQVPAKVNLSLNILARRADGYHTVETVMQTVDLVDRVTVESADTLTIHTDISALPTDDTNIVWKAATQFCAACGMLPQVRITLEKEIPMQAGLAGGSADAAGVLYALNGLYGAPFSPTQLCDIAATIGADVPFCLTGGTMLARGIGTTLTPLPPLPPCYLVIAKPVCGVSTAAAYAAVDTHPFLPADTRMQRALEAGDLAAIGAALYNRFEAVLALPEVAALTAQMTACGALGAAMTGSGSAVFGIFTRQADADACAERLTAGCERVVVCTPWRGGPKIV